MILRFATKDPRVDVIGELVLVDVVFATRDPRRGIPGKMWMIDTGAAPEEVREEQPKSKEVGCGT